MMATSQAAASEWEPIQMQEQGTEGCYYAGLLYSQGSTVSMPGGVKTCSYGVWK